MRPRGRLRARSGKFLEQFFTDLLGGYPRARIIDRRLEASSQKLLAQIGVWLKFLVLSQEHENRFTWIEEHSLFNAF